MLKKELASLRATQGVEGQGPDPSILDQQICKARGIDPQGRANSEVERSAHREILDSLELSESTVSSFSRQRNRPQKRHKVPA